MTDPLFIEDIAEQLETPAEIEMPETTDEVWEAHTISHNIRLVSILAKAKR